MTSPPVPIANIEAFLAVVGQWNLHDMEVRGLRYQATGRMRDVLELDFYLHEDNLRARPAGEPASEYEFIFRFDGAEGLSVDDFAGCIVREYEFVEIADRAGHSAIEVMIESNDVGDINFLCQRITVAAVRKLPVAAA